MSFRTRLSIGSAILLLCASLLPSLEHTIAKADYYPPELPYYWETVGSGGAKVQNQGTPLSAGDAVNAWNAWTAKSKLAVGTAGCGTSIACVIFAYENATLYYTYCDVPPIEGQWFATTHLIGVTMTDPDCTDLDDGYNLFVVVLKDQSFTNTQKLHIQRHEIGHAIGLWEALDSTACWTEWGYVVPVMKHDSINCSSYPSNYSATYNEALYAVIRSGW